jgi:hypothetical protein
MTPAQPRKPNIGLILIAVVIGAAILSNLYNKKPADAPDSGTSPAPARTGSVRIPPQPPPTADPTARSHDWENPGPGPDPRFEEQSFHANDITSSRTLDQTTKWLRWAVLQYGEPQDSLAHPQTIDVTFNGCSLQWTERKQIGDTNRYMDTITAMKLADLDIGYGDIMASGGQVTLQTGRAPNAIVTEKFYVQTNGELTPDGERSSPEGITYINLASRDRIAQRVAWALIHAGQLCGATGSQ